MLKSLYSKMLAWLLLNLLLIALVGGGFVFFVLFSNTHGLVPASLFSSNVENVFRVLSTELQYRSTQEWSAIVKAYDRPGLQFHLVSLVLRRGFRPPRHSRNGPAHPAHALYPLPRSLQGLQGQRGLPDRNRPRPHASGHLRPAGEPDGVLVRPDPLCPRRQP